ncbi:hypothetical protein IV203_014519 [Nitzschia inconspicua]|uniref:Uncharacterized protein n=1 Tax=Nitzschia inconspicua TaxID=303405 RepID=A0A9K3L9C5_9STRA|nr:hypothetical protein IV203_014493 [Nitzschia inconspicua]KAG7357932.1 hypothetical protein IV203_014519 [Nitzschia inconspicua]
MLLDSSAICKLEEYTTEMLVSANNPPLVPLEFKEFLFTRWFRSRFNVSNDVAFAESMKNASSHNITLMERDRFIAIQSCTRGYAQAGRIASVESNAWMQQGALLRKMKEIEVALFARSVDVLLHNSETPVQFQIHPGNLRSWPTSLEGEQMHWHTTVRTAESSATKHGLVVNCVFGDDTFKDCVPAENRAQVLHQALVTNFEYGLFVTSKVKGGEGSLVQVVVIQIPVAIRMTHGLVLCAAATPLLGFLHGEHVRAILKSRAKLYFAHLKLITMPDGTMKPTKPLLLYKHSAQHRYNKQKPGLDMNTELSDKVAFNSKGSFESKYVFRMMDAILVNAWRAHQAVFDIAPWLATLAEPPSLAQVRRKLHCAESIEDYTWKTSMESLAELTSLRRSTFVVPNLLGDSPANAVFIQQFQKYKENNVWPMRHGALEKFVKDPFLQRLRTSSFPGYEHKPGLVHELVKTANEGARRKCILCFVSKKDVPEESRLHGKEVSSNSSFMCRTCMVCLCKKRICGSKAKSCYDVWHERKNLDLEATKQRRRLLESREQEDPEAAKRRKNSANANSQKKSPSKSPCPFQDAQFQDEEEQPDEDELVEEDQQDEEEGDKMDEDDIEAEETEEQYYDDVYFPEDIDSLEDSSEDSSEEEEEEEE